MTSQYFHFLYFLIRKYDIEINNFKNSTSRQSAINKRVYKYEQITATEPIWQCSIVYDQ